MKWIKASERLPEDGKLVEIKTDTTRATYARWSKDNNAFVNIIDVRYPPTLYFIEWLDESEVSPPPVQSDRGVEEVLRAIHQNTQGPRYWPAIKLALGNYTSLKTKIIPSIDDAGVIAANISESIKPKLTEHEQAFFIAGFQECIKYLNYNQ